MRKIISQANYAPSLPERDVGERVTVSDGFIPPNRRIEQFRLAGEALEDYRNLVYHHGADISDAELEQISLTGLENRGLDPVEIDRVISDYEYRRKRKLENIRAEQVKRAEALQKAEEFKAQEAVKKEAEKN